MSLCTACAAIRFEDFYTNGGVPLNRTTSDVETCAPTCQLCALIMSASRNEWLPNKPLYMFGIRTTDARRDGSPRDLKLRSVDIYSLDLANAESGALQSRKGGHWTIDDQFKLELRYPKAQRSNLSIVAGLDAPASLLDQTMDRPVGPGDDAIQIQKWLQDCKLNHPSCFDPHPGHDWTSMPTRLIDIGEKGQYPKLVEVDGRLMDYLVLSHRWGGAKIYQTTQANLEAQKAGIDLESLCTTFRDALTITSNLGYQYIWIDSICIVQDSPEDWAMEATRMATVYMNAVLTLAAACAISGDTGLFHQRYPERVRMRYQSPSSDDKRNSPEKYYFLEKPTSKSFSQEVTDGPLNSRGWCLQERWLSRRTVHFGRTQRFWECQSTIIEESVPGSKEEHRGYLKALSSSIWDADAFRAVRGLMESSEFSNWYHIVCDYCDRDLTVPDDKFPAISGVASIFGSHRKDRYLAGLWEGDLQVGLLWCSKLGKGLRQLTTFRAPSWSWGSCDGRIHFEFDWDGEVELDIITTSTTLAGQDPYGKILAGFIEVSGFLEQIPNISPITNPESKFGWENVNVQLFDLHGGMVGEGSLDTPERLNMIDGLFCLMIFCVENGFRPFSLQTLQARGEWAWGLLLEPVGGQYRRVGLAQVHQSLFGGVKEKLTIV